MPQNKYDISRLNPVSYTHLDVYKRQDVVCIFVNDTADAEVIRAMADNGVKLLALRCAGYNNAVSYTHLIIHITAKLFTAHYNVRSAV